jgi:hypothetical protein
MHSASRTARVLAGVAIAAWPAVAGAAADDPTAAAVIAELSRAYAAGPVCERVGVEILTPGVTPAAGPRKTRASIIVRLAPPAEDRAGSTGALTLELGQLRITMADDATGADAHAGGRLIATHAGNRGTYAAWDLAPAGPGRVRSVDLERVLPSVLAPQIDLAAGPRAGEAVVRDLGTFARGVTWTGVTVDERHADRRTITGAFEHGTVRLTTAGSPAGARLKTMLVERPDQAASMSLTFSTLSPCDPARSVRVDTAARTLVPGLDELRPRGYTLRLGVRVPDLPLTRVGGEKWELDELLTPPPDAALKGAKPAEHAVLVFVRSLPPGATTTLGRFDAGALAAALLRLRNTAFGLSPAGGPDQPPTEPRPPIAPFGIAPVLVVSGLSADELLARLRGAASTWGRDVMWTTDPAGSIDLLAPGAEAAVAIIDSERVLRGVVIVEPESTAEQIADQIAAALFEAAAR